jgi:uncharacterized phage protein gp47/JayE
MPWHTPSLRQVREMVRDDITASLAGASFIGNNVLRVMSDTTAGTAHGVLRYIDWLSRQIMPDLAEQEWLDRFARMWLTNSDGTTGRKQATLAAGSVMLTGTLGAVCPTGTQLTGNDIDYETTETVTIGEDETEVPVRALDPGKAGNTPLTLAFIVTIPGIDTIAPVVSLSGGADVENDEDLRTRVLLRIRQPPQGGDLKDYVQWTLAVPGVTRAWAAVEMGMGTITVRFMMDDLRADNDGFPTDVDIQIVSKYIDQVRPVTVKDRWILGPIPQRIDVIISVLVPDDSTTKAAIEANLQDMLRQQAAPGQTIYAAWKSFAIMNTAEVKSFNLMNPDDDIMLSPGHMAVLGDILYTP